MFTGLVEGRGHVEAVIDEPPGVRLRIGHGEIARRAQIGDSISINGCCLTAVAFSEGHVEFEAGEETLSRTNLGKLVAGDHVNLESSLRVGDALGGHWVTGHIDGVGTLDERMDDADWSKFWFAAPQTLLQQMASKGSVAVDGVSLTLVDVDNDRFSVALIPHTLQVTTLGARQVGDAVNLETDVLAKYVQRQMEAFRELGG